LITGLGYNKLQNTTNIMKIARNPRNIVIGNLKEHKTLPSSIFLFGDLVLDMQ